MKKCLYNDKGSLKQESVVNIFVQLKYATTSLEQEDVKNMFETTLKGLDWRHSWMFY